MLLLELNMVVVVCVVQIANMVKVMMVLKMVYVEYLVWARKLSTLMVKDDNGSEAKIVMASAIVLRVVIKLTTMVEGLVKMVSFWL